MNRTRTIQELIHGLPVSFSQGSRDVYIHDIVEDSRLATEGCLFVARKGMKTDGRKYIAEAVSAGAAAVLTDCVVECSVDATVLHADQVAVVAAQLAERFYDSPSSSLKLIGITGTNGKTTTAHLIHQLLNNSGVKCGLLSTVQIDDGRNTSQAELTTPPAIEISRQLNAMVRHGCEACVMEASSHALQQDRTAGLQFYVGVFTNLSGDHLDYHKSMEEYLNAKAKLFESLSSKSEAVFNADDSFANEMLTRTRARIHRCSMQDPNVECFAHLDDLSISSIVAQFKGPWGEFSCQLPLIGRHNLANSLQAVTVCHILGLNKEELINGLEICHAPPGRLEPVTRSDDDFSVLVDYAHTDDALKNVLASLRPSVRDGGKLIVVFGCGGDRDVSKRPRMARIACENADQIIVTSDNPRTEDPQAIILDICAGVPANRSSDVTCIVDRREAIERGIECAEPGDLVLIAGKGHENYQIIGTTKSPFDDRKAAREALEKRASGVAVP